MRVTVTGTLPVYDPVRLVPDPLTGDGIVLTPDGLGAHFTSNAKMAIRANQGLYPRVSVLRVSSRACPGQRRRRSSHRRRSQSLMVLEISLRHVRVNALGRTWRELMFQSDFNSGGYDPNKESYYGFAVDYRRETPTVYVIIGARLVNTINLSDATVPLYPMLYGYPVSSGPGPDETINFGASAFHHDPRAILAAAGVDTAGLQVGWQMLAKSSRDVGPKRCARMPSVSSNLIVDNPFTLTPACTVALADDSVVSQTVDRAVRAAKSARQVPLWVSASR